MIAEYAYDAFSRRVKKTAGGRTILYHYDYDGNLISETDGAGSPIRDYVYLNGEPVAMKLHGTGAVWYFFLNDHLGTPQKVVNASGAVVWEVGYMPFGEARVLVADVVNNLRFPGQYFDAETGLHYNWHRYYDPDTGRYLTPDPIGLEGGLNLYVYVNGNPVNWADPRGLWGFAIDAGGAYGTGDGDGYTDSGAAGTGIYIGGRDSNHPDSRGSYAEIGAFIYQNNGKTAGVKIGLGISLTHYKIDASNFFKGKLYYKGVTFLGGAFMKYYDAEGNDVGWTVGLGGKGIGFSKDEGCSTSWSGALQ